MAKAAATNPTRKASKSKAPVKSKARAARVAAAQAPVDADAAPAAAEATATASSKTYQQLKAEIATLQAQAETLRAQESDAALARCKEAIALYGFTARELGLVGRPSNDRNGQDDQGSQGGRNGRNNRRGEFVTLFADGAGNEWNGRGPRPDWFKAALGAGKKPNELRAAS